MKIRAKLGTGPSMMLEVDGRGLILKEGRRIRFREMYGQRWQTGIIDHIGSAGGLVFISKL